MTEKLKGTIVSIDGPVVKASGMGMASVADQVEVGEGGLVGEIIEMTSQVATIQVYEDTTGMRPGQGVLSLGRPLSVELGPGLVGGVFDGIQRPLEALALSSGDFISTGVKAAPLDVDTTRLVQAEQANIARRAAVCLQDMGVFFKEGDVQFLGPAPAPLHKLRGRYRYQMLLKAADMEQLNQTVRDLVETLADTGSTQVICDVEPMDMM